MELNIQHKLELFVTNAQTIKEEFAWHNAMTRRLAALLYAQESKPVDNKAIRRCQEMIKRNTGVFSMFRGNTVLSVSALLSLSPDPQSLLDETLKVYDMLKDARFGASDYLVIAAYQIAAHTGADYADIVNRARAFYDGMKKRHFLLTGQDDYIFAAMLGLSDIDIEDGLQRMEQLYEQLSDEFWSKDSVQALAQVLVLGDSSDGAVKRVLDLRSAFREQGVKLDKTYTLPTLGTLALLPVDTGAVVRDVDGAQSFLRERKGFGAWSVSTQELLLYATALVTSEYAHDLRDGVITATLSTSITNIIIAEQTAIIAAMSASSAAAAASLN
jgi:hypothetical protein